MTRTARSRKHQGFDLDARLSQVEGALERNPGSHKGAWALWGAGQTTPWERVCVDIGCGKGDFIIACAKAQPNTLFVGLDCEPVCLMHGAEKALAAGLSNAVFALDNNPRLDTLFDRGEVCGITMNFPTPFPRKKETDKRLTYAPRFVEYAHVLAPDASLFLRTDSDPFLQFTKHQAELAGWEIAWETSDCRKALAHEPFTEYERKLSAEGATVLAVRLVPANTCATDKEPLEQTPPESLFDYLPEDLDSLDYVPHGMVGAVTNWRNRNRNQQAKAHARKHS